MKNLIFISLFTFISTFATFAQDDCIPFLPKDEGTVLVNKSYNANNQLISTLTFKVDKYYSYSSGERLLVDVILANEKDSVVEKGVIDASCEDGVFYMKMSNKALSPKLIQLLGHNTTLIESFMGAPNDATADLGSITYDDGPESLLLETKKSDQEIIAVKILNRKYAKDELLSTPAGIFQTTKVTFDFEVTQNGNSTVYKGAEWYAVDAGIVRSETYDLNNKIKNYTLLTVLKDEDK